MRPAADDSGDGPARRAGAGVRADEADDGSVGRSPNRWLLVSLVAPPPEEALLLIDALRRTGARAVERAGDRLIALLPPPSDVGDALRDVAIAVRASTSLDGGDLRWSWQSAEEWAARWHRELGPRRITERIVVAPAGTEPETRAGDVVIRLVPGTAFGTAEHATTRACLRFLESLMSQGARIADIGAGSGILSVAAALLGARTVLAAEADPWACAVADENARANGVADRIDVRELVVDAGRLRRLGRFDGVLANLETPLLLDLIPAMGGALRPGGWLVLSGATRAEGESVLLAARAARLEPRGEAVDEGWWTGWFAAAG